MGIKDEDMPSNVQVNHDLETIATALEAMAKDGPNAHWHSVAFQCTAEGMVETFMPLILAAMLQGNMHSASNLIIMHLEMAFVLGHNVGEGPTHIVKTPCSHHEAQVFKPDFGLN